MSEGIGFLRLVIIAFMHGLIALFMNEKTAVAKSFWRSGYPIEIVPMRSCSALGVRPVGLKFHKHDGFCQRKRIKNYVSGDVGTDFHIIINDSLADLRHFAI
jgi:hypothetical protein